MKILDIIFTRLSKSFIDSYEKVRVSFSGKRHYIEKEVAVKRASELLKKLREK